MRRGNKELRMRYCSSRTPLNDANMEQSALGGTTGVGVVVYFGRNHCTCGDTRGPARGKTPTLGRGANGDALTDLGAGSWDGENPTLRLRASTYLEAAIAMILYLAPPGLALRLLIISGEVGAGGKWKAAER